MRPIDTKWYKWFYDHIHSKYYNLMIAWILLPFGGEATWRKTMLEPVAFGHGEHILEMCCGTGGATFFIAEKAPHDCEIAGMDLSRGQLAQARRRTYGCRARFVEGDVTKTGFPDSVFDKVFITHAIHEMTRHLRLRTLREAKRLLKPGGEVIVFELDCPPSVWRRLFIGLWFFYWLPGNFETPTRRDMLRCGVSNEVRESGFANVRKYASYHEVFQTVIGTKEGRDQASIL